jgi:hypothetical protein
MFLFCLILHKRLNSLHTINKGKAIPLQAGEALSFQDVEAPKFQENRHMKVLRLLALRTGRLYLRKIFLVLIYVRI